MWSLEFETPVLLDRLQDKKTIFNLRKEGKKCHHLIPKKNLFFFWTKDFFCVLTSSTSFIHWKIGIGRSVFGTKTIKKIEWDRIWIRINGKRDFKKIYHNRGGVAYFMTIANNPYARQQKSSHWKQKLFICLIIYLLLKCWVFRSPRPQFLQFLMMLSYDTH